MKNKRLTYLLLPIVAAIWGYAIYKYLFTTLEEPETALTTAQKGIDSLVSQPIAYDSFALLENYPDPFRAGNQSFRRSPEPESDYSPPAQPRTHVASAPKTIAPPTRDLLAFTYCGLVQQTGTARQTGILRAHAKSYFVQPGDQVAGLTVLAVFPDSLRASTADGQFTLKRR